MKRVQIIVVVALISGVCLGQTGPNSPSTVVDDASNGGSATWSFPSNARISDNSYADVGVGFASATSDYLKCTDFSFSIPSGDVIDGVELIYEGYGTNAGISDDEVFLVVGGIVTGINKAIGNPVQTSEGNEIYGGPIDLWGTSLTDTDINSSDFGVVMSFTTGGIPTYSMFIDHVTIIIHHHSLPSASPSYTPISCFGGTDGTASANASGGKPPLTYLWSTTETTSVITGLSQGTYSVTIEDSDFHSVIENVTISEPAVLTSDAGIDTPICENNIFAVGGFPSSSGGNTPYTYLWSGTGSTFLNNTTSANPDFNAPSSGVGTFQLSLDVIDNEGCNASDGPVNITVNPVPDVGLTVYSDDAFVCTGDATNINVDNTVIGVDYQLRDDAGDISIGGPVAGTGGTIMIPSGAIIINTTYNIEAIETPTGCSGELTSLVSVNANALPTVDAGEDQKLCYGISSTSMSANNPAPDIGMWTIISGPGSFTDNTAFNSVVNGVAIGLSKYRWTVTDANGCANMDEVDVEGLQEITITPRVDNETCAGNDGEIELEVIGDPLEIAVGVGTIQNTPTTYPSPFGTFGNTDYGLKHQFLIKANEISTSAGMIKKIALDVVSSGGVPISEFAIKMKHTTATSLSNFDNSELTEVFYVSSYTDVVGWNDFILQNPFYWNGIDNLIVQFCLEEITSSSGSIINMTNVGYNVGAYYKGFLTGTACSDIGGSSFQERPSFKLEIEPYLYNWSTGATTRSLTGLNAGNYYVTITDAANCSITEVLTITNGNNISISEMVSNVSCVGGSDGSISLTPVGGNLSPIETIGIGVEIDVNYPQPYGNYYEGAKHQFLIKASEILQAQGDITSLAFDVAYIEGTGLSDFTIKIKHTTNNAVSSMETSGFLQVYTDGYYIEHLGWNTHVFDTPFTWNGTDNLLIEICFQNNRYTANASVFTTNVGYDASIWYNADLAAVCSSGSFTATAQDRPNMQLGYTTNYTYLWSNSATTKNISGLAAGIYDLTITDLICPEYKTVTVTEPTLLTTSTTVTDVSCISSSDGMIVAGPLGGTSPFTYLWDNATTSATATGLANGTYLVTVTDFNGCEAYDSDNVNDPTGLTGTFTVGGATPIYATINDAVNDLICLGVSTSVTFNIRTAGSPYNEQVSVGPVNGTSDLNRVVFQSEDMDSLAVVIQHSASGAGDNYVWEINGADYISLNQLTVKPLGTTFGRGIVIQNNADGIEITNNIIESVSASSTNLDQANVFSSSAVDNETVIENNVIINGSYGVYLDGATDETGTIISGNVFEDQYAYGLYLLNKSGAKINFNHFSSNSNSSSYYGSFLKYCDNKIEFESNLLDKSNGLGNGFGFDNCIGTSSDSVKIVNNVINMGSSASANEGLSVNNCQYHFIFHNTVNISSSSISGKSFMIAFGTSNDIFNNIFNNSGLGYAVHASNTPGIAQMDFNNLFTAGDFVASYLGSDEATKDDWNAVSGYDANSISLDPVFESSNDLHLTNSSPTALYGGTPLSTTVRYDYDGKLRNTGAPWMGAFEHKATFYWVGDGGNWDNPSHWGASTNGTTMHLTFPFSGDDVIFDANSFTGPGQVITLPAGEWYMNSIDFQDANTVPSIVGSGQMIIGPQ